MSQVKNYIFSFSVLNQQRQTESISSITFLCVNRVIVNSKHA
jgi:hypothetical protein